jgi:hypothetical protein
MMAIFVFDHAIIIEASFSGGLQDLQSKKNPLFQCFSDWRLPQRNYPPSG